MKTDLQIHLDVLEALKFDPRIAEQAIAVAVKNGVVTLAGEVSSHAEKVAVEDIIKQVGGVRGFAEELQVNPPAHYHRNDHDLVEAAVNALRWNVVIPSTGIVVKVEKGWLTLTGEVTWQFERDEAFEAMRNLKGVRGVSNKIVVKPRALPSEVKEHISKAFQRGANQDAQDLRITVSGGTVTLEGIVTTWAEFEQAEYAAWSTLGISQVINKLAVRPPVLANTSSMAIA